MSILMGLTIAWLIVGFFATIMRMLLLNNKFSKEYGLTLPEVHLMYVIYKERPNGTNKVEQYPNAVKVGGFIGMITVGTLLGVFSATVTSNQKHINSIVDDVAKTLKLKKKD